MKKRHIFHALATALLMLRAWPALAHTINHDLAQMYGQGYLPLFVVSRLLPFAALGLIASGDLKMLNRRIAGQKIFFTALIIGFVLSMFIDFHLQHDLLNSLFVIGAGFILIFLRSAGAPVIQWVLVLAGGSLGVEYGLFTSHAHDFIWLYISLLVTGTLLFLTLSRIRITGHRGRKPLQFGLGIFMILGGLVMLLLS